MTLPPMARHRVAKAQASSPKAQPVKLSAAAGVLQRHIEGSVYGGPGAFRAVRCYYERLRTAGPRSELLQTFFSS